MAATLSSPTPETAPSASKCGFRPSKSPVELHFSLHKLQERQLIGPISTQAPQWREDAESQIWHLDRTLSHFNTDARSSDGELLPLPRHVAIIMDGNGRWARRRGKLRWDGHSAGADAVRSTLEKAGEIGLQYLTLYAFSVNNWSRPRLEVEALMHLLTRFARKEQAELIRQNIRVRVVGDLERLPKTPRSAMHQLIDATAHCTGTTLSLALSYGGRADMMKATKALVEKARAGEVSPEDITEESFHSYMSTSYLPSVDLLIRTGGESRISDFLLYEAAYAELCFLPMMWPEFRGDDLVNAIDEYRGIQRRFGLTGEQIVDGELALVGG